ncbi:hypothetical protein CPT_Mushroom117 [Salmonella phage Mushroom]|uniref:Uncharacterized protein n=8 Tax=root TaxID=1 RepID=A0A0B5H2H5_9CAUD|nr:hypothetical protein FDH40_gp098 [Salmonella phage Mushroom]AFU63417.1 hypothetical protein [Salmonella phage SBA-1781]AFU63615.1 hypothetical protein [Salmonella phage SPT-1]AUE22296.1 hypothetical protein vse11_013 [Salmonella virus VSe11]AUE22425.1 hypothetical protein vse102_013 [Salmonella virus VSe102]EHG9666026.1 hypothetical protein [Salmonella enterica]QPI14057.1 hypothetical protein GECvBB1_gp016 [Salmonella phage GEC_vB_B1]QPI14205.1 hypothetical protein GECvBBS_gp016 [Salmonel
MAYRAPKFINKGNFRNALEKSLDENFTGHIIVVHAYNFKYDINGNKINHYTATMLDGALSSEKAILHALAGRGKNLIRCDKRRYQGGAYGCDDAIYHLENMGYSVEKVGAPQIIGSDGYVTTFKIR